MTRHEQTWDLLQEVIDRTVYTRDPIPTTYRQRQRFELSRDDEGNHAILHIHTYNPNSYRPGSMRLTNHEFLVPCATYNRRTWMRWLFDRLRSVEDHELCESFLVDGERVYAPHHGNGEDPYVVWYTRPDRAEQVAKAPGDE